MKRLEIVLIGHSRALSELGAELDAHGHVIHSLSDTQALEDNLVSGVTLLIEDGTLDLSTSRLAAFKTDAHLGLRVGLRPDMQHGMPHLELLCWYGSATPRRVRTSPDVAAAPPGDRP